MVCKPRCKPEKAMATTINVLCYRSKTLKNGEHPLMLCICKDRTRKYKSLNLSVKAEHWNFNKNEPKSNCPNREYINLLIASKKAEYEKEAIKLQSEGRDFTADSLHEIIHSPITSRTVSEIFNEYIDHLKREKRTGYMKSVIQVYNSLIEYNKHLNIYFDDIDYLWLREYEIWLKGKGLSINTIGIRFRTLRTIYNYAMTNNWAKAENYPFKKYKVSKLNEETIKRALSKNDINRIIHYRCSNKYMQLAVDIFAFTYYVGGINFVDIANLTHNNIINGRLVYKRQKTGKLIKVPLPIQAMELIEKYRNNSYLFPIFNENHKSEQSKSNRLHKVITKVNFQLKWIGTELGLPIVLTTYVARHSQATVMKKAGVPTALISQIMGHSSEKVTQIYLDSFENTQIDEAMKHLL